MSRTVSTPTDPSDLTAQALSELVGENVLNCLGKQPGPPNLGRDFVHILDLPKAARDDLWTVLEPNLGAINTPQSSSFVEAFCERHALDPRAITPVIGACRFLFKRGAERNTPTSLIEEDIKQLLGSVDDIDDVLACVVPCYERAAAQLRRQATHEALTDHGRVLTDVKWRVDNISHANTGESINVPVTMLTLRFREGEDSGQMTLQVLPNEVRLLQEACARALRSQVQNG